MPSFWGLKASLSDVRCRQNPLTRDRILKPPSTEVEGIGTRSILGSGGFTILDAAKVETKLVSVT